MLLKTSGLSELSAEALVNNAAMLKPVLRARQRDTESARCVPEASITDIRSAGLYKVLQPARYGGCELDFWTFARCAAEIGAGCGSTAWVYSTAAAHQWQIGMFDDRAQSDIWGSNPNAIAASSYSPGGKAVECAGGYRLSGRWLYCSGVLNAQWMILGVLIAGEKDAEPHGQGYVLVPREDFEVEDNWDVIGLIGTGSSDVVIEDIFVPSHRMLLLEEALSGAPPGSEVNGYDLWKVPFFAAISICLCVPIIGMAQGALEVYVDEISTRKTRGAALSQPKGMAAYPTIQSRVAEAAAAIDAAKLLLRRDCEDILRIMGEGRPLSVLERAPQQG